jgi:hypothetical protein
LKLLRMLLHLWGRSVGGEGRRHRLSAGLWLCEVGRVAGALQRRGERCGVGERGVHRGLVVRLLQSGGDFLGRPATRDFIHSSASQFNLSRV